MPLLRCRQCGYEYRTELSGWGFSTNAETPCIGKDVVEDGTVGKMHRYNHPFMIIEADAPKKRRFRLKKDKRDVR